MDLNDYPQPIAGQQCWVIQLPGLLPRSSDPAVSSNPADWRVQLIVGQNVQLDCNQQRLVGHRLRMMSLNGMTVNETFLLLKL
ncbi:Ecotin [Prochlorococcus marinus str. MIT 1320]|nr:Ecotin [Prochlorococcus marinus str. MIT 1320]